MVPLDALKSFRAASDLHMGYTTGLGLDTPAVDQIQSWQQQYCGPVLDNKGRITSPAPFSNKFADLSEIQVHVAVRIGSQIPLSKVEQLAGGPSPAFSQVYERSRQLDESLEEGAFRTLPVPEPEHLQHFVGFKIHLSVEAIEIAQVMGLECAATPGLNQSRQFVVFLGQGPPL